MKTTNTTKLDQRRTYMNAIIIVIFTTILAIFIFRFNPAEPEIRTSMLQDIAKQFQSRVMSAQWQWKAEDNPQIIMLVHYNNEGRETDRRPVHMTRAGLPKIIPSVKGCETVWRAMVNEPMTLDGYRVIVEYDPGELSNNEPLNARCRYRLSVGSYFDYAVNTGTVTFND